jgi:hypothetical protein
VSVGMTWCSRLYLVHFIFLDGLNKDPLGIKFVVYYVLSPFSGIRIVCSFFFFVDKGEA